MEKLWKFFWDDCYSNLEGLFLAEESDVTNAIGRDCYLGEIAGKHSEVEGEIESGDITLVSDDADVIEKLRPFLPIGIDPLEKVFYECSTCGERLMAYEFDSLENPICDYCKRK